MARRVLLVFALVLAFGIAAIAAPPHSEATVGCTFDGKGHYYSGYQKPTTADYDSYGARALLLVRPSGLCMEGDFVDSEFTTYWVLISSNSSRGYMQAGYIKIRANPITQQFSEYCGDITLYPQTCATYYGGNHLFDGESWRFMVAFNNATRTERSYFGGLLMQVTYFDPTSTWISRPWLTQYYAESDYRESDIPGSPTAKAEMTEMEHQSSGNATWEAQPCGMVGFTDSSRWDRETISCAHRREWTK